MAEGGTVLSDLVLRKTLGVADQDLVLSLVQGTVDGGNELGPAGTQSLGGEGGEGRSHQSQGYRSRLMAPCRGVDLFPAH